MKWLHSFITVLALLCASAHAEEEFGFVCGGWDGEGSATSYQDSLVVTRIVFIGFPDEPNRQDLPSWADTLKGEFSSFIESMSHGKQTLQLSIVKRLDDSTKVWVADSSAAEYNYDWHGLNREILKRIHDVCLAATGDSIWKGVEQVCIYHYTCVWSDFGYGGYAFFGFTGVPALEAEGFTLRFPAQAVNSNSNRTWSSYATGHEYGHNLGFVIHTPNTDDPDDAADYVNMGRYDCMRGNGGNNVSLQGFLPYHVKLLADNFGWLDVATVNADTVDLRIPDVRDADDGKIYRVNVPNSNQHFLLANHQGTDFDGKYSGTGLLVWHILPNVAWDLECAGGKSTSGNPDPVSGKDALEISPYSVGSAADFFTGDTLFTCGTNPHAYLYQSTYSSAQDVATPIALENIRDAV